MHTTTPTCSAEVITCSARRATFRRSSVSYPSGTLFFRRSGTSMFSNYKAKCNITSYFKKTSFIHSHTPFLSGEGHRGSIPRKIKNISWFTAFSCNYNIVLLTSCQDRTKQGTTCNHATCSLDDHWASSCE